MPIQNKPSRSLVSVIFVSNIFRLLVVKWEKFLTNSAHKRRKNEDTEYYIQRVVFILEIMFVFTFPSPVYLYPRASLGLLCKQNFFKKKVLFTENIFSICYILSKTFFMVKILHRMGFSHFYFFLCFETPEIAFDSMKVCRGKLDNNTYH